MIAANELMKNNYVRHKFNKKQYSVVTGFDDEYVYLKEITFDYVLFDDIEPIPLTEEWLLKFDWNGFKTKWINSYFKVDERGCIYYRSDFTGTRCFYVHQLQNLYFALTYKHLTIKQ